MVFEPWLWSVFLMIFSLTLILLEVFVPSGGILGVMATLGVLASVAIAFNSYGAGTGFVFVLLALIGVPAAIATAFRILPKTPMGRRLLLQNPSEDEVLPHSARSEQLRQLIGKQGRAKNVMLPSGAVVVDGQTVDAVSEGMPIEAGQTIEVVDFRGNRLVVRPTLEGETGPDRANSTSDILSEPIDNLGIEPLDDPLA